MRILYVLTQYPSSARRSSSRRSPCCARWATMSGLAPSVIHAHRSRGHRAERVLDRTASRRAQVVQAGAECAPSWRDTRRRSGGRIAGVPARAFPRKVGIRRIGALGRVRRGRDGRRLHPRALRRGGRDRGLVRGAPLRRTVRLHRARAGDFLEGQPMAAREDPGRCAAADHQPVSPAIPDRPAGAGSGGVFRGRALRGRSVPVRTARGRTYPRHQQRRPARREEGLRLLLRALACLPEPRPSCRIVGDGPLRADLEQEIRRRGLADSVQLLGALPHGRVREVVERSRCSCCPAGLPPMATRTVCRSC